MTFLAFLLRASWHTVAVAIVAALASGTGAAGLVATLARLEEAGAARLLAALTDDVLAIGEALPAVPIFATNLATVAGVLAYLGWLSWPVLLAVLGVVAVGALGFRLIAGAAMRAFERAREERDTLLGHFRALIEGIKELKLSAARRAAFLAEVLEPSAEAYRRKVARGRRLYTSASGRGAGGPRAAGFRLSADRPRRRHTPLHAGARRAKLHAWPHRPHDPPG